MPRPVVPMLLRLSRVSRQLVHALVVGHQQVGRGRDEQAPAHRDALLLQGHDLVAQGPGVDDHAAAQQAAHALVQHPRGHQVQHVLLAADVDGVAGVGAALVAQHPVDVLAQGVDDLALALVAPLAADDHPIVHAHLPVQGRTAAAARATRKGTPPGRGAASGNRPGGQFPSNTAFRAPQAFSSTRCPDPQSSATPGLPACSVTLPSGRPSPSTVADLGAVGAAVVVRIELGQVQVPAPAVGQVVLAEHVQRRRAGWATPGCGRTGTGTARSPAAGPGRPRSPSPAAAHRHAGDRRQDDGRGRCATLASVRA